MKVTRHYQSETFTIEMSEKEMMAISTRIAFEEGRKIAQKDIKCARLLQLIRELLNNYEWDWE